MHFEAEAKELLTAHKVDLGMIKKLSMTQLANSVRSLIRRRGSASHLPAAGTCDRVLDELRTGLANIPTLMGRSSATVGSETPCREGSFADDGDAAAGTAHDAESIDEQILDTSANDHAARAIRNIATNPDNQVKLMDMDAGPKLLNHTEIGNDGAKEQAAGQKGASLLDHYGNQTSDADSVDYL